MNSKPDLDFKFRLLLKTLGTPKCRFFIGDEQMCALSEEFQWHLALNCYGNIHECDLPEKFRHLLIVGA